MQLAGLRDVMAAVMSTRVFHYHWVRWEHHAIGEIVHLAKCIVGENVIDLCKTLISQLRDQIE